MNQKARQIRNGKMTTDDDEMCVEEPSTDRRFLVLMIYSPVFTSGSIDTKMMEDVDREKKLEFDLRD